MLTLCCLQLANRKVNVLRDLVSRWSTVFAVLNNKNAKYTSNDFIEVKSLNPLFG